MGERIRGRLGIAMRKRRLQAEPLCRDCKAKGMVRAAAVVDHVLPLALGGMDIDENIRCLCKECHTKRTAEQFGHKQKVSIGNEGWPEQ